MNTTSFIFGDNQNTLPFIRNNYNVDITRSDKSISIDD